VWAAPALAAERWVGRLAGLVDKSLVGLDPEPAGPARYRMLDTVRQYAAEQLAEAAETDYVRRRHTDHFLALAEHAATFNGRPSQAYWLGRLGSDHDDPRSAPQWCGARAPDGGVPLAVGPASF